MNELRKDYLLNRWVIIAKDRAKRPTDFVRPKTEEKPSVCYFCPGNEHMTPPETDRVEEDGKWVIRCFPNKFPAVTKEVGEIWDGVLSKMPAWGGHEVIAETPNHGESLGDLPVERLVKVLDMYTSRIAELRKDARTKYVMVFKNQGKEAGASLDHSHTQIISLPIVPPLLKAEADASAKYRKEKHKCPFCDIILKEKGGERRIFEDEHTIAFAPFASRFPFEAWVMPKRHLRALDEMTPEEKRSFASTLKKLLSRLDSSLSRPPYNFWLHYSPDGCDLHMHLELATRLSNFAGMEYGSDIVINVVPPESAAAHYRGE